MILLFDLAMLALCTALYRSGAVSFRGFLVPLIALMSSYGPVTALAGLGTTPQATVASGARVLAVIDEAPETEDIGGMAPVSFSGADAEHLGFAYGEEPVLQDVSLSFPENRIIGIVGKSGCGKSTLLKLLMRFWKAKEGAREERGNYQHRGSSGHGELYDAGDPALQGHRGRKYPYRQT